MRKSKYYSGESLSLKFYDALTACDAGINGDIPFYGHGLAHGEQVLDIGSGTGRVAFGLAEQGLRVIGIDISAGMIREARRKQSYLPPRLAARIQFLEASATRFSLPVRVRRVLFSFYTFNFLENRKARVAALELATKHLESGGDMFLHCIPIERLKITRPSVETIAPPDLAIQVAPDMQLELYWRERKVDSARQITSQTTIYQLRESNGLVAESSEEELVFHWISDTEIATLAHKIGLELHSIRTSFLGDNGQERIYRLLKR